MHLPRRYLLPFLLLMSVFVVLVVGAFYFFQPARAIFFVTTNGEIYRHLVADVEQFEMVISYDHSVIKQPVVEVFSLAPGNGFMLIRTAQADFGAGLPTEEYESIVLEDGKFVISGINRLMREIPVRITAGSGHSVAHSEGAAISLAEIAEPGTVVTITAPTIARGRVYFNF